MKRVDLLSLLKVYKGEGVKVSLLFTLGVLLQFGTTVGLVLSDALFLSRLGSEKLPYLFIFFPGVMLFVVLLFSYLLSYFKVHNLFYIIFILMGGLSTFFGVYLNLVDSETSIFLLKIYSYACMVLTYTIYWSFIDDYFSILDAKRLYPFFSGALTLGAIFGGCLVLFLGEFFSPSTFLFFWSFLCGISIVWLRFCLKKTEALEIEIPYSTFTSDVKEAYSYASKTPFFYIINVVLLLTVVTSAICEYKYSSIFSKEYTEEELVPLIGMLFAISNSFTLIINFFVFGRLISNIGISNMILIQPIVYFITFVIFLLEGGLFSAFVGFFAYHAIMVSIDYNNWNFLFNAFPGRFKKMIRSFSENLIDPFATAIAGVLLLIAASFLSEDKLTVAALCIVTFFTFIVLLLRSEYLRAMITTLKDGALSFSRDARIFGGKNFNLPEQDLEILNSALLSGNLKTFRLSFYALIEHDPINATLLLLSSLKTMDLKFQKRMGDMFSFILKYKKGVLSRYVLEWLQSNEQKDIDISPALFEELAAAGFLDARNMPDLGNTDIIEEKRIIFLTLWNSWNINDTSRSFKILEQMFNSKDEIFISSAVSLIGKMGYVKYAYFILPYLRNESRMVRTATIASISNLLSEDTEYLIIGLIKVLEKGDLNERLDILKALFRLKDASFLPSLLKVSDSFSSFERRRVLEIINNLGDQSVPILITIFSDESETYVVRVLVARALGNISITQYQSSFTEVVYEELVNAYEVLYTSTLLDPIKDRGESFFVLYSFYNNIFGIIIDFILQIIAIAGQLPDLELVSRSLSSSSVKERSNAIETLEQGVSHKIFKFLLPLIDGRSVAEQLAFFWDYIRKYKVKSSFSKESGLFEVIQRSLASSFPLENSIALGVYWELSGMDGLSSLEKRDLNKDSLLYKEVYLSILERSRGETTSRINIIDRLYAMLQVPIFARIGVLKFQSIAQNLEDITYQKGESIFEEGEDSTFFHVLLSGNVNFESTIIHSSVAHMLFSEIIHTIGFYDCFRKTKYSATCIASTEVRLLKISKKILLHTSLSDSKVAWELVKEVKSDSELLDLLTISSE